MKEAKEFIISNIYKTHYFLQAQTTDMMRASSETLLA